MTTLGVLRLLLCFPVIAASVLRITRRLGLVFDPTRCSSLLAIVPVLRFPSQFLPMPVCRCLLGLTLLPWLCS